MSKSVRKLLEELCNNPQGIRVGDFVRVVEAFGFEHCRTKGSHQLYRNPDVLEPLNLQEKEGEAKPYQVRQLLRLVEEYKLELE